MIAALPQDLSLNPSAHVIPVPGDITHSSGLKGTCTCMAYTHTGIQIKIKNKASNEGLRQMN